MNRTLWTLQITLSILFAFSGVLKIITPYHQLASEFTWVMRTHPAWVQLVGCLEVCAACGLLLPQLLRVQTWLTPLAAFGISLLMIGGAITHYLLSEMRHIYINITIGLLSLGVGVGRLSLVRDDGTITQKKITK